MTHDQLETLIEDFGRAELEERSICEEVYDVSAYTTEDKITQMDISCDASLDCDKTMFFDETIRESSHLSVQPITPLQSNVKDAKAKMERKFKELASTDQEIMDEHALLSRERIIVSFEKLRELKGLCCSEMFENRVCGKARLFSFFGKGSVRQMSWSCSNGHMGTWTSSEVLCTNHKSNVFVNDMLVPICVLLSGNNYGKFKQFCDFLRLHVPDMTTFCRVQSLYCFPEILDFWSSMKSNIYDILNDYNELCLCGDGRNDSPGHSAKFCCYVAMEHFTNIVVDVEVLDVREVGASTNMEREGLTRILTRLASKITISEIVTDASASILKRIQDLKVADENLANIYHSLDIWHRAKAVMKNLQKKARTKGNEELIPWIDAVVNHFWYSCAQSKGDTEQLMVCILVSNLGPSQFSSIFVYTNQIEWDVGVVFRNKIVLQM